MSNNEYLHQITLILSRIEDSINHIITMNTNSNDTSNNNSEPEYTFTPGDIVLVRDDENYHWKVAFFNHSLPGVPYPYYATTSYKDAISGDNEGTAYKYCIPFEASKVGTRG